MNNPSPSKNTLVKCEKCKNKIFVSFGKCLRSGWPECCGYTMTLVESHASIESEVSKLVGEAIKGVDK